MEPNGSKWSQMDPSGAKWIQVEPSSLSLDPLAVLAILQFYYWPIVLCSYCISELCELVYHWVQRGLRPVDPITPEHMHSKVWHTNFLTYLLTERQPRTSLLYVLIIDTVSARVEQSTWQMPWWLQTSKHPGRFVDHLPDRSNPWIILLLFSIDFFVF